MFLEPKGAWWLRWEKTREDGACVCMCVRMCVWKSSDSDVPLCDADAAKYSWKFSEISSVAAPLDPNMTRWRLIPMAPEWDRSIQFPGRQITYEFLHRPTSWRHSVLPALNSWWPGIHQVWASSQKEKQVSVQTWVDHPTNDQWFTGCKRHHSTNSAQQVSISCVTIQSPMFRMCLQTRQQTAFSSQEACRWMCTGYHGNWAASESNDQ